DPITCEGTRTYSYTFEDCAGNSDQWSFVYTIELEPFILPANGSETVGDIASAVEPTPPTVNDNCGNELTPMGPAVTEIPACQGIVTYTYTYTDCAGNSADWTYTYTIELAPFTAPDDEGTNVECIEDAVAPAPPIVNDSNGDPITPVLTEGADPSCEGDKTYTFTYTDCAGNKDEWIYTYTIKDETLPIFNGRLPEDLTVECDAIPSPENLTATDNCGTAEVTVNDVNTPGDCDGSYTIARTYTATDECGLTASYTQTITVIDTTAPTPSSSFETELTVSCTEIPDAPSIEFTDNCSNDITIVFNETNGFDDTVFQDYQIIRTWTVRDACNNEAVYTQTLNVLLDEVITQVTGPDRCFDDGVIDLNEFLTSENKEGTWELVEGNDMAELNDNIFNPTTLEPSEEFLPGSESINYVFRYTGLDNGCINITEVSMAINADCIVLPCGDSDIVISKALTPNGDGHNDFFYIAGIELCGFQANIKIFNRWGALIFESSEYPQIRLDETDNPDGPDGSWKGNARSSIGSATTVPNGTYYYIIELRNPATGDLELNPITGPLYIGSK
ncbi:MAG: gliding motility-associated C-terminal domain-containing protein, partial [Jejuia sp.]